MSPLREETQQSHQYKLILNEHLYRTKLYYPDERGLAEWSDE